MEYDLLLRYLAKVTLPTPAAAPLANVPELARRLRDTQWAPVPISQLDLATGKQTVRLRYSSPDSLWAVDVMGASVDVTYGGPELSFGEFCAKTGAFLAAVLDSAAISGTRLAAVQEGLLRQMSQQELATTATNLLNHVDLLGLSAPFEWDWRCAMQVRRQFGAFSEETNTIALIKRLQATRNDTSEVLDRLRVDLDTNTAPSQNAARFDAGAVLAFFDAAPGWHADLAARIVTVLGA